MLEDVLGTCQLYKKVVVLLSGLETDCKEVLHRYKNTKKAFVLYGYISWQANIHCTAKQLTVRLRNRSFSNDIVYCKNTSTIL